MSTPAFDMDASAATTRAGDLRVMSLVGFAHATSHFFHLVIPSLFPWLMADFGLTFTRAGTLTTAFFVISGVGQAVAGFAVDRFGAQRVLLTGAVVRGRFAIRMCILSFRTHEDRIRMALADLAASLEELGNGDAPAAS